MSHSPKKIWAGALSALLALFAALVVTTPALATTAWSSQSQPSARDNVELTANDDGGPEGSMYYEHVSDALAAVNGGLNFTPTGGSDGPVTLKNFTITLIKDDTDGSKNPNLAPASESTVKLDLNGLTYTLPAGAQGLTVGDSFNEFPNWKGSVAGEATLNIVGPGTINNTGAPTARGALVIVHAGTVPATATITGSTQGATNITGTGTNLSACSVSGGTAETAPSTLEITGPNVTVSAAGNNAIGSNNDTANASITITNAVVKGSVESAGIFAAGSTSVQLDSGANVSGGVGVACEPNNQKVPSVTVSSGAVVTGTNPNSVTNVGGSTSSDPNAFFPSGGISVVASGTGSGTANSLGNTKVTLEPGSTVKAQAGMSPVTYQTRQTDKVEGSDVPKFQATDNVTNNQFDFDPGANLSAPLSTNLFSAMGGSQNIQLLLGRDGYTYATGSDESELQASIDQLESGGFNPVKQPAEGDTYALPEVVAFGFDQYGDSPDEDVDDAAAGIAEAIGQKSYSDVANDLGDAYNVMWAVLEGEPGVDYGAQFEWNNANGKTTLVTSNAAVGGVVPANGAATTPVTTSSDDGYIVIWFSMTGGSGTPGFTIAEVDNPTTGALTNGALKPGTYTVSAWPSGQLQDTGAANAEEPVTIAGVQFTVGETEGASMKLNASSPAAPFVQVGSANWGVFGTPGTDITLPGYGDVNAPSKQALNGWINGTTSLVPASTYELQAPAGANQYVTMTASFGAQVSLGLAPSASTFPTGTGEYDDQKGTLTIGATADGTLPELPIPTWNGLDTVAADAKGYFNGQVGGDNPTATGAAFAGWYGYDAKTDTYTLYQAGDKAPSTGSLYPLFAPVSQTWTPSSPVVVTGNAASSTFAAEMDTDLLPEVLGIDEAAAQADGDAFQVSTAATAYFDSQVEKALTEASTSGYSKLTGLEGVTCNLINGVAISNVNNGTSSTFTVTPAAGTGNFQLQATTPYNQINNGASTNVTFTVAPQLTVNVAPTNEAGTVNQTAVATNNQNSPYNYTLTAVPADGWHFDHWTGPLGNTVSTNPTLSVGSGTAALGTYTAVFDKGTTPTPEATVQVMRAYNPYTLEHLYTTDANEYKTLTDGAWQPEGVAWTAPTSGIRIVRLYNPNNGDHMYTTDAREVASLKADGWSEDSVLMYSADQSGTPIYRLFNPYMTENAGAYAHLWTADFNEYTTLHGLGWNQEGVAFYGVTASGI